MLFLWYFLDKNYGVWCLHCGWCVFSFSNVQGLGGTRIMLTCQSFESQARAPLCVSFTILLLEWFWNAPSLLTISECHMCQCVEQPEKLALCGLDPYGLHCSDRLQDNNKSHLVNVLKVFDAFWPLNCLLLLDAWLYSYWMPFGHISGIFVFPLEGIPTSYSLHMVIGESLNLKAGNMNSPSTLFIYIFP